MAKSKKPKKSNTHPTFVKTPDVFTVTEAAIYIGISTQWLYQMKHKGIGPKYLEMISSGGPGPSRRAYYSRADLDAWNEVRLSLKGKGKRKEAKTLKKAA